MVDKSELCEKIIFLYPEIGECGIDIEVDTDDEAQSTIVILRKGNKQVRHFLPDGDAEACMAGRQCVALGLEIGQLRDDRYL